MPDLALCSGTTLLPMDGRPMGSSFIPHTGIDTLPPAAPGLTAPPAAADGEDEQEEEDAPAPRALGGAL